MVKFVRRWLERFVVGGLIAACSDNQMKSELLRAEPLFAQQATQPSRRFLPARIDTIASFATASPDLHRPYRMAATRNVVAVADLSQAVWGFDLSGRSIWKLQLPEDSAGPGRISSMRSTPAGSIAIIDSDRGFLYNVDNNGKMLGKVDLTAMGVARVDAFAPSDSTHFFMVTESNRQPIAEVTEDGHLQHWADLPWKAFRELDPLARQGHAASDEKGERWAFAFAVGDGFFILPRGRGDTVVGRFVEHIDFPTVIRSSGRGSQSEHLGRTTPAALDVGLTAKRLYVLFGGESSERGKLVDAYDASTGQYLSSIRLPSFTFAAAVTKDFVYLLTSKSVERVSTKAFEGHP